MTDRHRPSDDERRADEAAEKRVADAIEEAIDTPTSIESAALEGAAEIEEIEAEIDDAVAEAEQAVDEAEAVQASGAADEAARRAVREAQAEIDEAELEIEDADKRERELEAKRGGDDVAALRAEIDAAEETIDRADELVEAVAEHVEERARALEAGPVLTAVAAAFPAVRFDLQEPIAGPDQIVAHVGSDEYLGFVGAVRDAGFEMFIDLCGVDYLRRRPRYEVVVTVVSLAHRARLRIRVGVPAEDPAIPSIVSVYPGANFYERETYDLFGVRFDGHPDLTRILLPDDWEGHPLRKDYAVGSVPVQFKEAPTAT